MTSDELKELRRIAEDGTDAEYDKAFWADRNNVLSLLARIEALEQDAAQYRALRSGSHDDHIFIAIDSGAPGEPPFSISGEWADKEVDLLIVQQDKGKETLCAHQFVNDEEHRGHAGCQKCGAIKAMEG